MREESKPWLGTPDTEYLGINGAWTRIIADKTASLKFENDPAESNDELRFKLKVQTELTERLKSAIHKLRVGYFKELDVLRTAVQGSKAEIEHLTQGVSPSAELETFITDNNVYFYDIKDGLIEPDLLEVFQKAVKHSNRLLLEQLHAMRQLLAKAGIDVPGGTARRVPESPRRRVPTQVKDVLSTVTELILIDALEYTEQAIEVKPIVCEVGLDAERFLLSESGFQTLEPSLSFLTAPITVIEALVETPPHLPLYDVVTGDVLTLEPIAHCDVDLDTSDLEAPPPKRVYIEVLVQTTKIPTQDQEIATRIVRHATEFVQTDGVEAQPESIKKQLDALTEQDTELLDAYVETFKRSIVNSLRTDPAQLLKELGVDLDTAPVHADALSSEMSSEDEHQGARTSTSPELLISHRALPETSRERHDHNNARRQIMALRAEIGDLEGRLCMQSRRLNRAMHYLNDVKREKDESFGKAEEYIEKVRQVRDTVRKLRRELRSRDRKIHYLSRNLVREIRRRNHSCPPPAIAMEIKRYERCDIAEDAESDMFLLSTRSVTKVRSFSFAPITSARSHDTHASHHV